MQNSTRAFLLLAGVAFWFLASGLCLANLEQPKDLSPILDPVFGLSLTKWYWAVVGMTVPVGGICFLSFRPSLPLFFVILFTAGILSVRLLLSLTDTAQGFAGYLGPLGGVVGLRAGTVEMVLLAGSFCLLVRAITVWRSERRQALQSPRSQS